jgi:hypothetical protein
VVVVVDGGYADVAGVADVSDCAAFDESQGLEGGQAFGEAGEDL